MPIHIVPLTEGPVTLYWLCHEQQDLSALAALAPPEAALTAVTVSHWQAELSPWPAPPLFEGGEPFDGGAQQVIDALAACTLPTPCAIGGYSLAGLCALYAATRLPFQAAGSASGSLWYPGFLDYLRTHPPQRGCQVVLSAGRKEARTRHPLLRQLLCCHETACSLLTAAGCPTTFTVGNGGHQYQVPQRQAALMAALCQHLTN